MTAVVDGFSGIGWGFACEELGLVEHGIDNEPTVGETRTRLGWTTTIADIRDLDPTDWSGVEGMIFSPPCQSWSRAGKGLGLADPRGQLVWTPLTWTLAARPRWVACEQVPEARGAFDLIAHRLREVGYHADVYYLSAECFGVPQTRRRVFLVAHADRQPARPQPSHTRYRKGRARDGEMLGLAPWVSMAEAIGCPQGDECRLPCACAAVPPLVVTNQTSDLGGGRSQRDARSTTLPSPTMTTNGRLWSLRYRRGAGMVERHGQRPDRQLDEPSFCLTTGAATGGAKHQWWPAERPSTTVCPVALTEWQGCRLMGFPDRAVDALAGNKGDRWRIIGNAVCPPVGRAVLATLIGQEATS